MTDSIIQAKLEESRISFTVGDCPLVYPLPPLVTATVAAKGSVYVCLLDSSGELRKIIFDIYPGTIVSIRPPKTLALSSGAPLIIVNCSESFLNGQLAEVANTLQITEV